MFLSPAVADPKRTAACHCSQPADQSFGSAAEVCTSEGEVSGSLPPTTQLCCYQPLLVSTQLFATYLRNQREGSQSVLTLYLALLKKPRIGIQIGNIKRFLENCAIILSHYLIQVSNLQQIQWQRAKKCLFPATLLLIALPKNV